MTFSFHGSLRSIPTALREVATLQKLSAWRTFRLLELPAATIGLVWNSMMSMAGGWFFLTVCEAFTLSEKDYRLPGLGSYMSEAINKDDNTAKIAGVIAMTIMIVAVDQLFWRPIVVWSERFKVEDQASSDPPESWMLNILQRSKLYGWLLKNFKRRRDHETIPMFKWLLAKSAVVVPEEAREKAAPHFAKAMRLGVAVALIALAFWGAYTLVGLLIKLPLHEAEGEDWIHVFLALAATFLRVSAAMILGTAWALPVGIMIGLSPRWSQRLQPIIQFCASFPAPMIFPMVVTVVYFLHIPFTFGCVALMLLGTQWYILFNVIAGAMAIPQELKEVTTIYRCSKWQRWTKLYLPNVTPYLLTGLVTAAGGAWNASIVSEYLVLKGETTMAFGLGSMISQATAKGNLSLLAAAVTTMAIFVVLVNRFFWKRLYRIAENRFSMNV